MKAKKRDATLYYFSNWLALVDELQRRGKLFVPFVRAVDGSEMLPLDDDSVVFFWKSLHLDWFVLGAVEISRAKIIIYNQTYFIVLER